VAGFPNTRKRSECPHPALSAGYRKRTAFTLMDRLFDHVRDATGSPIQRYDFFGHSAGGQFAHRFVMFLPSAKTRVIISANSGWHTFPTVEPPFPYGLGGFRISRRLAPRTTPQCSENDW